MHPIPDAILRGYRKRGMQADWNICVSFDGMDHFMILIGTARSSSAGLFFHGTLGARASVLIGSAVSLFLFYECMV